MATYQQWSQSYFVNNTTRNDIVTADLTPEQHEINNHPDVSGENVGVHKLQPLSYYDYRNKEVSS